MEKERVFHGKWICAKEFSDRRNKALPYPENFFINVYKDFICPEKAEKLTVKISADDYCKLYVNGSFVGQGPAPGYVFAYNYNEYDLTPFIKKGQNNEIRVTVYYQGLINRVHVSGDGNQGMIADIYADGKLLLSTDESWLYEKDESFLPSHILGYDTGFSENRDLRISPSEKENVYIKENIYTFEKEPFPSVEIYPLPPEKAEKGKHSVFFDFGKEMAGTVKLKAFSEKDGEKIILHLAEELDCNGSPRFDMRCGCRYEDSYILKKGENLIEQFDYKAFRFGEIIKSESVEIKDIQMLVRHYPFNENHLTLKSDNEILNRIFNLCKDTIKYGCGEAVTDCPTREKGQYLGDVTIAGFSHLYLTGDGRLLKKALKNFADSYRYSGEFLAVSPCSLKQKIADYALQFPLNLWRYYLYTKDRDFLEEMLPLCDKINDCFSAFARTDGLLEKVNTQWNLVDWPDNLRDGYDFDLTDPIGEGCHNVINAFYIGSVVTTEKIKEELCLPFERKSKELKNSFNKCFFDEEKGLYTDSETSSHTSLHGNALPVFFGINKKEKEKTISDFLLGKGLSCGVYMAYFYLTALFRLNRPEDAIKIMTSEGEHGWYNMLKEGATTCFEAWGKEQKWNTSLFHPWATAPVAVLFEQTEYHLRYSSSREAFVNELSTSMNISSSTSPSTGQVYSTPR